MYFKQFYLGCLAHASYLIGSASEAAVVDPQRDIAQYLDEATAQGFKIKYVIETHLHADFVSGHRELAARTGAQIVFGQKANAAFPHLAVKDGDELPVGQIKLRVLETPGHTPESISVLVIDPALSEQPLKVLTGDTLFIGDVGRPDLASAQQSSKGYSSEQMAGLLYDSLHGKLLTLADAVEVYPAHGAGSLCGRNMSKETSSTIGQQRQFNYALQPMPKDAFVKMMTTDLPEVPAYFPKDVELNRSGATELTALSRPAELTVASVQSAQAAGALVLDVRASAAYANGHIPGALNIGLGGQFASWAGTLLPLGAPLVLVAEDLAQVDEAVLRLARVGIESVQGYLGGGMYAWDQAGLPVARIAQWTVDELQRQLAARTDLQIIDVRRPGEFNNGHVPGACLAQLAELEKHVAEFDAQRPTVVICQGGYRSIMGAGILAQHGFTQLFDVVGGTSAWVNTGYAVEGESEAAPCARA